MSTKDQPTIQAVATQRHLDVAASQTNPTSSRLVDTVVVGSGTVDASKLVPHAIVTAPVPVMAIHSFCPLFGVPVRLVVNEVIFAYWPVMTIMS